MKPKNIKPKIKEILQRKDHYVNTEIELLYDLKWINSINPKKILHSRYYGLIIISLIGDGIAGYWVLDRELNNVWLIKASQKLGDDEIFYVAKFPLEFKELIKEIDK